MAVLPLLPLTFLSSSLWWSSSFMCTQICLLKSKFHFIQRGLLPGKCAQDCSCAAPVYGCMLRGKFPCFPWGSFLGKPPHRVVVGTGDGVSSTGLKCFIAVIYDLCLMARKGLASQPFKNSQACNKKITKHSLVVFKNVTLPSSFHRFHDLRA